MVNCFCAIFMLSSLLVAPDVSLYDEQGHEVKGQLVSVNQTQVSLKVDDVPRSFDAAGLMSLQVDSPKKLRGVVGAKVYSPTGDLIIARTLTSSGNQLTLDSPAVGQFKFNASQVKSILFGKLDDKVSATWNDLVTREIRNDLLVIRKGDVLDFLNGVVGDITPETIKFLTDGNEIPVKREKVFGLVYYRKTTTSTNLPVKINFTTGESIYAEHVEFKDQQLRLHMGKDNTATVAFDPVKMIDFSRGKLVYVSDLIPVFVNYTPRGIGGNVENYKQLFQMKIDKHMYGDNLKLANRTFAKGLCLHADTTARYKLGLQYKTLVGTLGIDADSFNTHGNALVIIRGDDQVLFEKNITGMDDPLPLSLDVSKIRELSLEVTVGADGTDLGDNVIFGGLYLLKHE